MRHIIFRVLILLLTVGFLVFAPMLKSEASGCNGICARSCNDEYNGCLCEFSVVS
jgi:hypothetical protein